MSVLDDQARLRPFLLPGERLIWTGRPQQGLIVEGSDLIGVPAALAFGAFLVWMRLENLSADLLFVMSAEGLTLLGVLHFAVGRFLYEAWARRRLLYGVTNQRVLKLFGSELASHDLAWLPKLQLEQRERRGTITIEEPPEADGWFSALTQRISPFSKGFLLFRVERPQIVYDLIARESRNRRAELNRDLPAGRMI